MAEETLLVLTHISFFLAPAPGAQAAVGLGVRSALPSALKALCEANRMGQGGL